MSEFSKNEKHEEIITDEIVKMSEKDFEEYSGEKFRGIWQEKDLQKQKELLKSHLDIYAQREQRIAIPMYILGIKILLKYGFPEWKEKEIQGGIDEGSYDEAKRKTADEIIIELKSKLDFLERLRQGEYPDDWTQPYPGGSVAADRFFGHGVKKVGHLFRIYNEGREGEGNIWNLSQSELIDRMFNFMPEGFEMGGSLFGGGDFGPMSEEQVREVADENRFEDMVGFKK